MLGSYVKIGYRNLLKNKLFTVLNLLGLSVGIAAFMIVSLYVFSELSVDRFNKHYHDIYRIEVGNWFTIPAPAVPILREHMAGLEAIAAVEKSGISVSYEGKERYVGDALFVEPDFFDVFTINIIRGNGREALAEPDKIILSESEAKRIFGLEDPIGKLLTVNKIFTYTVTGIFEDFTDKSILQCQALSAFSNRKTITGREDFYESWSNWNYQGYVRLTKGSDPKSVIESFNPTFNTEVAKQDEERSEVNFSLRSLFDIYFYDNLNKDDFCNHGNKLYLILFSTSAILILLIAIINFINLSTARSGLRAGEIGIRKVCGADRIDLIKQFLGESFFMTVISFLIAIALTEIFLPFFNQIVQKKLTFDLFSNPLIVFFLIVGIIKITILTGLYPAFYMSSFKLIAIMKKENFRGKRGLRSRRFLMILQFVISTTLLFGTIVIYAQMRYMLNKDLGYDKEQIVYLYLDEELRNKADVLKQKLLSHSIIKEAAFAHSVPGNFVMEWGRETDKEQHVSFFCSPCDENYIPLLNLTFVAGRNFDPRLESDKEAYIVNEAFVKKHNMENPLEESIGGKKIIGVVKDFAFQSLHNPIKPMAFVYFFDWSWMYAVKFSGDNDKLVKEIIKDTCREINGSEVGVSYLEDNIKHLYMKDRLFSKTFTILSALAIFISILGLVGLISFEAGRRFKEIGIRKVLGASVLQIFHIFNKELFVLLGISSIIAWICGYFIFTDWLQNFAFRIDLSWKYFLLATLITGFVSLLTFSLLVIKSANSNPVEALKYE
ncbi:MAG: ABC transporter permease [Candidatus Cloacimonetes bacterium]|nr:ABC transporter permease [Candidatus Cloacimonadota bacterium]